jgi:hypothetical protein
MFRITTSIVCWSGSVGLNSTISVPAYSVHLLAPVGEGELDLALEHVAEVGALASVVREAGEQRGQVRVSGVGLEADGVAAELFEVALVPFERHRL